MTIWLGKAGMMNKLTSKCNDCPSRKPYWEHVDGTKEYQCVEIVCKRQGEKSQMDRQKHQLSEETPTNTPTNAPTDLIRRQDAIKAFSVYNGESIPEVDCDNFPIEIPIKQVKDTIRSLQSVDDEKPCKTCGYYEFECPQDCEYNKPIINTSIVRCEDCRYKNECHKSVQYTRNEPNSVTIGFEPIEWCSRGERREE